MVCIVALISSCTKDELREEKPVPQPEKKELTPQESILKGKLGQTALLVTRVAADRNVQRELYNFVNQRYEGNYRVMFRHLLKPETLTKNAMPVQFQMGAFRDSFMKEIKADASKGASAEVVDYLIENNIEIAWHYSQEWNQSETPTVTFNPLDNDSVNVGYKTLMTDDGEMIIDTVLVDDDYAFAHPVLIIDQHEDLPDNDPNAGKFLGGYAPERQVSMTGPWPDGSAKYNKIYIYQVRTTNNNFRGLFKGENNMYFRRAGSEVVYGPNKTFSTKVSIDRWAGRKEVWRTVNVVWDENWQPEEVTQWIGMEAIHVHKDKTVKYSGDVSLKLEVDNILDTIPVFKPSLTAKLFGWEVTIDWENEMWYDNNKTREEFFRDNFIDAYRNGTKNCRCIYIAGTTVRRRGVYFTFDIDAKNY